MSYKRVLVLLKGFLGDAVMVTPLLDGLTAQGIEVHVLTSKAVVSLLQSTFPKATFHLQRELQKPGGMLRQARELRALHFDAAFVVNRSFRSALLAALARIPVRVGHSTDRRKWLLTKSTAYDAHKYEPASYLDLAEIAGLQLPDVHPRLTAAPDISSAVAMKLNGATVAVQPGARHPWKRIPTTVLVQVVTELQKHDKVVLLGGPEEKEFGDALSAELLVKPLDLIGALSLTESIAAASHLKVMVGGDTGLMHIAAAAGCPTVTMFGPTFATKWGHHYEPHQVLAAQNRDMADFTADDILAGVRRALCCS